MGASGPLINRLAELEKLNTSVEGCQRCELSKNRINAVPGHGIYDASVMFVGEAPGKNEDGQGLPFVGRAGKLLDQLLLMVPLLREDIFITNLVKCRPPSNRDPEPIELKTCSSFLNKQIGIIDPKVIVTLGRFSMNYFYENGKISRDHGKFIQLNRRILVPLYHPAAALRNPNLKQIMSRDIQKIPQAIIQAMKLRQITEPTVINDPALTSKISDLEQVQQLDLL